MRIILHTKLDGLDKEKGVKKGPLPGHLSYFVFSLTIQNHSRTDLIWPNLGKSGPLLKKQQNQDFGMGPGVQIGVNFVIENKSHLGRRGWKKYKTFCANFPKP